MNRSVYYCLTPDCELFGKVQFLSPLTKRYNLSCLVCLKRPHVEEERGVLRPGELPVLRQVIVHFDYRPLLGDYSREAKVWDDSLPNNCSEYELWCPLVLSEKRALEIGESLMALLNMEECQPGFIPGARQQILNLNSPTYYQDLTKIEEKWQESPMTKYLQGRDKTPRKEPVCLDECPAPLSTWSRFWRWWGDSSS